MTEQNFILTIVVAAIIFLLLLLLLARLMIWFLRRPKIVEGEPMSLMSQIISYGGSSSESSNDQRYYYYTDARQYTAPQQPYYQPVPQRAAPVAPGSDPRPAQPNYSDPGQPGTPDGRVQPIDEAPAGQPTDYSEQEPAHTMPDIPYYQPVTPVPAQPDYYYQPAQPIYQPDQEVPDFYDILYTPAPIQPIAPPQIPLQGVDDEGLSDIPPYVLPSLEDIYQGPASDHDTMPDPGHFFFEENTSGIIGLLPVESGIFEIPEIFDELPLASYPEMPRVVDADSFPGSEV